MLDPNKKEFNPEALKDVAVAPEAVDPVDSEADTLLEAGKNQFAKVLEGGQH
jgi:hypothetical protein